MGGWKRMIMGEKMPDAKDPKYADRVEREVSAGRKFAKWLRIDKAAGYAQCFACKHPKLFLGLVFGIVIGCFTINICNMVRICNRPKPEQIVTAAQHQEQALKERRGIKTLEINDYDTTGDKE